MTELSSPQCESASQSQAEADSGPASDLGEVVLLPPALLQRRRSLCRREMVREAVKPSFVIGLGEVTAAAGGERQPKAAPALLGRRAAALDLGAIRTPTPARAAAGCQEAMGDYGSLEVLGRGAFGSVYRANHLQTGQTVALKTFHASSGDGAEGSAKSEHQLLRQLDHPHIVRALDFYTLGNQEVLVMEFFTGASISRALQKMTRKRIADGPAQNVFRALLKALSYMHSRGFVHKDVKPDNVLVSEDFKDLRLVDFNLACPSSDLTSFSCAGTEFYAAPEVLVGAPPTEANDVWGAGVCLHLMLSGRAPELCGTPAGSADGLLEVPLIGARWANVSDGAKSAVHHCLALQREFRQTASGMLEHPWVHASQPAASGTKLHQASKFYSI